MRRFVSVGISLTLALLLLAGFAGIQLAAAADTERGISLTAPYTSIVVPLLKTEVDFDITLKNTGGVGENVDLIVDSAPEGWLGQFWSIYPENIIRAAYLPPKEEDADKYKQDLRVKINLPQNATQGDYVFMLKAVTADKTIVSSLPLTVTLSKEVTSTTTDQVQLIAESFNVQSQVGNNFVFTVHVTNKTDRDLTFDLAADIPLMWGVFFNWGWHVEKINSLLIKSNATEDVRFTVTPSLDKEPGTYPREYPVTFHVKSGDIEKSLDLRAVITATYQITLTTPADRPQLNGTATAGKATHISLVLVNNGTAPLENISFTSSKPDGWTITFTPDKLDALDASTTREIDVAIEPGVKTIAGDYATILKVNSKQGSDSVDFRVTVETSTTWGWVGIVITILVIAALLMTFIRLRRR